MDTFKNNYLFHVNLNCNTLCLPSLGDFFSQMCQNVKAIDAKYHPEIHKINTQRRSKRKHCFSSQRHHTVLVFFSFFAVVLIFVLVFFMFVDREREEKNRAPGLQSGPVAGDESWTVHQTGHRIPVYFSRFHGINWLHYQPHIRYRYYLIDKNEPSNQSAQHYDISKAKQLA